MSLFSQSWLLGVFERGRGITRIAPKSNLSLNSTNQCGTSSLSTRHWGVPSKSGQVHTHRTSHLVGLNGVFMGLSSPPRVYIKQPVLGKHKNARP